MIATYCATFYITIQAFCANILLIMHSYYACIVMYIYTCYMHCKSLMIWTSNNKSSAAALLHNVAISSWHIGILPLTIQKMRKTFLCIFCTVDNSLLLFLCRVIASFHSAVLYWDKGNIVMPSLSFSEMIKILENFLSFLDFAVS